MAYLHEINKCDMVNVFPGKGATVSIFFNGCSKCCLGCFNACTWTRDKNLYRDNDEVIEEVLEALDAYTPLDIALAGGDPLEFSFKEDYKNNVKDCSYILQKIKEVRPNTKVIAWTGYDYDECIKNEACLETLKLIDILIDGRYIRELEVTTGMYGSTNQRILYLENGEIVRIEK
jgi:anaerobic ribonucleoside-triphosphate reductase activating protein